MKTCLTLAISLLLSNSLFALDLPPIKAGFWESNSITDGQTITTSVCIDKQTLDETFKNSVNMMGSQCSKIEVTKSDDKYLYVGNCLFMGSTILSKGELFGNFDKQYSFVSNSTMTPALMGQSSSRTTQENKYKGACPQGVQPGDIVMPDGQKINVNNMLKQLPNVGDMMKGMGEMGIDPAKLAEMFNNMK